MNIDKYLNRIDFSGKREPTLEVLNYLQKSHLLNVPFENLDIYNGIPITLNIDSIYTKIVTYRRGGFCYELNGLYYELLNSLGFNVKRVSARVWDKENGYGAEFDHLALLVNLNGRFYLSDVGFGEFTFAPLKFETDIIQQDERGNFVIDTCKIDGTQYFRVNKIENDATTPEYIFTATEREFNEFESMCQYHQSSPSSHFTQKRLVSIPTIDGRTTITGNLLKIKKEGNVIEEYDLQNEEQFRQALMTYFKIDLGLKT